MRDIIETLIAAGACEEPPKLKILMGPIGSGKSRFRRTTFNGKRMSNGCVVADQGEIYRHMRTLGWPGSEETEQAADRIGQTIVAAAIRERRNITVEITGDALEPIQALIAQMKGIGYTVDLTFLGNSLENCLKNNAARGEDNISAFYSQDMMFRWFSRCFEARLDSSAVPES